MNRQKGQTELFILIGMVVLFAVFVSGGLFPGKKTSQPSSDTPCVDYNPPSTAHTVSFGGETYNLIKENVRIPGPNPPAGEEDKVGSGMSVVESRSDGKDIYKLSKQNYFGEALSSFTDIIYVKRLDQTEPGTTHFDVYIKQGTPIPDFILNCKKTGGLILVPQGQITEFPPPGFNSSQIIPSAPPNAAPSYLYTGNKILKSATQNFSPIGGLTTVRGDKDLKLHGTTIYLIDSNDAYEYRPHTVPIDFTLQREQSLQARELKFVRTPIYSWWTPECKPAVYLYPKEKQAITVKISPKGFFTLAIPPYPQTGWHVTASPDGAIETDNQVYPYLYYEAKIADSEIKKPQEGFVVAFSQLPNLFDELLPKLGLSQKEANDFKSYWLATLPQSNYYFVGVMDGASINAIEPLEVIPQPDKLIRVRLYFERIDSFVSVPLPTIETPKRDGFTVVEWGGIVKTDPNRPFSCLM